jgi:hypothetical protein
MAVWSWPKAPVEEHGPNGRSRDIAAIGGVNLPGCETAGPFTRLGMSTPAASKFAAATRRRQSIASGREVRGVLQVIRELLRLS